VINDEMTTMTSGYNDVEFRPERGRPSPCGHIRRVIQWILLLFLDSSGQGNDNVQCGSARASNYSRNVWAFSLVCAVWELVSIGSFEGHAQEDAFVEQRHEARRLLDADIPRLKAHIKQQFARRFSE
jgi:hypothetical protein